MNPLIEMYEKMLEDPNAYDLMADPVFNDETMKLLEHTTPEQQAEFQAHVMAHLQTQIETLGQFPNAK